MNHAYESGLDLVVRYISARKPLDNDLDGCQAVRKG